MPISLGVRERGCPYHCDSAFCHRVGEREDPGDDDDPQAFPNALLSTTRLPRKINVVQPADLSNKHPGALYYSIDNRNILGMTTLTHVYVRRANFITKLRFEIVELRSFA